MNLPVVAQLAFYNFLALIVGLGLLFGPFRSLWYGVSLDDARIHGGRFDPNLVQILICRLCAVALMLSVELLLCFVTLFRICMAYDDPDVLENPALAGKVALLLGFWFIVTISTVAISAIVGGHVLVTMAYLWEPEYTSGNTSSELELGTAYNEADMERLPLLSQSTAIAAAGLNYSTFDWPIEEDTLVPSSPGSLGSDSSITLPSDFGFMPFPEPVNTDLDALWLRHIHQLPPLRPQRHAIDDDTIRDDILRDIEIGSGAQSEFSDADDEMDPVEREEFAPVEAVTEPQSETSDADDEMDEEESESEPLLRRSGLRQQDGTDAEVSPVSPPN